MINFCVCFLFKPRHIRTLISTTLCKFPLELTLHLSSIFSNLHFSLIFGLPQSSLFAFLAAAIMCSASCSAASNCLKNTFTPIICHAFLLRLACGQDSVS
ncbi:hypothetical protein WN943_018390 [Citrus x changshan-huyou]